ncbi:ribosomal protein L10, putative [Trichomonas vaginalis G3]|uniref:60S acidic ribosomal protein P0 n=1 Tax=Trichomonas vaginalis (strain ATCC PRA-98 / G3) TaxID=412133 RepID=A2EQM0_TRIV3|nr:ribosome biogenesis [Trichomonas vaginalis G3]EAY05067.1 ribosomal protein L10, putative [Trichomonas vaginalis G3]KAI5488999.1 ribosome biogenesis [Trichomonas vaginalis G3]|eukprot:XP_001317290.1 ribosomal protein L10 [Trichomonas vaginalis G3]
MQFDKPAHQKKAEYIKKLHGLFRKYHKVAVVTAQNVTSNQLMKIRAGVSGFAEVLFGKNSLMRRAVDELKDEIPSITELEKNLSNGAGLIFTNGSFKAIKEVIDANCLGSAAKPGSIAPCDVFIKPQRTSISPTDIKVLHALNIQCKVFKGTIEITGEKQLIWEGQKVGASEANILGMLGILPFNYTLKIEALYDNGSMYDPSFLSISDDYLAQKFTEGLCNVTCVALGMHYPCVASTPHMIRSAFTDIASIAISINHEMRQIETLQKLLADPEALANLANTAETSGKDKKAEEHHEEEEAIEIGPFSFDFDF